MKNTISATLTVEEAAKILGIGRNGAYQAARTGQIPVIRIGRRFLVPRAALAQLLGGEITMDVSQTNGSLGRRGELQ